MLARRCSASWSARFWSLVASSDFGERLDFFGGRCGMEPSCADAGPHASSDFPGATATIPAMKPFRNLAETRTPDGSRFSLHEHNGEFFLKLNGTQLMGSNATVSERLLADHACDWSDRRAKPRVLIGGLGLGFSLRRVLELVAPGATVEVAELLPEVVAWNREFLRELNGPLLDDPRVIVTTGDVFECIKQHPAHYDAILLDVDNGPTSFVQPQNSRLYGRNGFSLIRRSLRPGGRVAFWSADKEPAFLAYFARAGFSVEEIPAKAHERAKRAAHRIYVGQLNEG
jgi:SAM-dependent methyltransferase